jgi:hypothetical protein
VPPPYILTIRDQILYEHAVVMSRAAFGKVQHAYVHDRFKLLRDGRLQITDSLSEWEKTLPLPRECVFCGSRDDLVTGHLVPRARGGADSAENSVPTCRSCNAARDARGVFEWLGLIKKDSLHPIVAGHYLMQLLAAHEAAGTLDVSKEEIGGFCAACPLPGICEEWATEGKMTCFCLESILPLKS